MAATFPGGVKDFADKVPGQAILSSFMNEVQDEIEAIETELKKTTGSVVDHGALAGTSDDDHPQYTKGAGTVVDNSIVRFDQTTGREIQDSNATLSDDGTLTVDGGVFENNPHVMRGAKVVITNPYSPKAHTYKGQMHFHATGLAHAPNTPAEAVTAYKNAGYHWVSLTNHDEVTSDPAVSDILFIPGCETTVVVPNAYSDILQIGATNNRVGLLKQATIDAMLDDGAFVEIAHPNWNGHPESHASLSALNGYYGIEIYNGSLFVTEGDAVGRAENRWDELLTDGLKVLGHASDDCHDVDGAGFNLGWIQVFADALTQANILDSLKRGNFYSSTGAELSVDVAGNVITATTGAAGKIEWIGKGGVVLRTSPLHVTTDSYTIVGDELYVRIKVTRDSDSKWAWSNPIWVDLVSTNSLQGGGVVRGNLHVTTNKSAYGGTLTVKNVNANGQARIDSSAVQVGENRTAAGTSSITFHSAVGNDYDSQIVAEGGTDNGANLTGTLKVRATSLVLDGALSGTAKASGAEVLAGTVDTKFVTPLTLQSAFGITAAGKALIDDTTVSNQRNTLGLKLTAITRNDDTATSFTPTNSSGFLLLRIAVGTGAGSFALVTYDAITGTAYATLMIGSANIAVTTGALAGTTGTDGKLTISAHTDGKIYIENRLGGTAYIGYLAL